MLVFSLEGALEDSIILDYHAVDLAVDEDSTIDMEGSNLSFRTNRSPGYPRGLPY